MALPTATLFLSSEYPSIQTPLGNPSFPGPTGIYVIFRDSDDRVWGSTVLPIWVFFAEPTGPVTNPFGENRDVANVGDRGEFYSFIERVPGEVWGGAYSATDRITRFAPGGRAGFSYPGIARGWRPKGVATDGTTIWWMGNNGDPQLGTILATDAVGGGVVHLDVVDQILLCADHFGGTLFACGSGEGQPGAQIQPRFYAIDPTTMTVDWFVALAGSRPLSMLRLNAEEYLVICHLTSSLVPRLVLVNIVTQERVWVELQPDVRIFGRARNALFFWENEIWTIANDGIYTIDLPNRTMVKRCNLDPIIELANLVASERFGLLAVGDTHIFQFDPR